MSLDDGILNKDDLEAARKQRLRERLSSKLVRDIIGFSIFLAALFMVAYKNHDANANAYKTSLENLFTKTEKFQEVSRKL